MDVLHITRISPKTKNKFEPNKKKGIFLGIHFEFHNHRIQ